MGSKIKPGFVPIEENLLEKPKTVISSERLGIDESFMAGLKFTLDSYVGKHYHDGIIPADEMFLLRRHLARVAKSLPPEAVENEFIETGWIEREGAGFKVAEWEDHYGARFTDLQKEAARKRKERESKRDKQCPEDIRGTSGKRPGQRREEKSREEERSCPESLPDSEPISLLTFPTKGNPDHWALTQETVDKLSETYPRVDVLQVCRNALEWVTANPKRKKTAKRMKGWLSTVWLTKAAVGSGETKKPQFTRPGGQPKFSDWNWPDSDFDFSDEGGLPQ